MRRSVAKRYLSSDTSSAISSAWPTVGVGWADRLRPMATNKSSPSFQDRKKVSVGELMLDNENPRFAAFDGNHKKWSELELVEHLLEHADLAELVQSMAANGYLDIEPIIALPPKRNKRVVIEGNRRLAALRLLTDRDLSEQAGFACPPVSADHAATMRTVSVLEAATRADARQYIGFKHINGPHKWDSFAKARFAADWYAAEGKSGLTLRDIAQRLGDRHDTVLRLVNGIFVLDQAETNGLFSIDERYPGRPFAFSHLYTALTRAPYRVFLGLSESWRQSDPEPDPVPKKSLKNLGKVLLWLYGSKVDKVPPVVTSQNPHIKHLAEVLAHPVAAAKMVANGDLAEAFAEVDTPAKRFSDALIKALRFAEDAQKYVYTYEEEDEALKEVAKRLAQVAKSIRGQLNSQ